MKIQAQAAFAAQESLKNFSYESKNLGPYEVLVKISHCGICHSDVHMIDNDWMMSQYPLVPGHEIVGVIEEVGSAVNIVGVGIRVGIGWQRAACHSCDECDLGFENLCKQNAGVIVGHHGGFATHVVVDHRFVFPIPASLSSAGVAPLLCGGITVYSPLKRFLKESGKKVGVIGMGGLGHLAVRFAVAMGHEVTVFSTSANKEKEAKNFGVQNFIGEKNYDFTDLDERFDLIINTVHVALPWENFINILSPHGTLVFVGAPAEPISVTPFNLIMGERSIAGSMIGGRPAIVNMLGFAARHKIEAQTEVMPLSEVNQALNKLRSNQVRYRMVLDCTR